MFVFDITTPGTWLDYEDRDWSWRIQNQIQSLHSQFFEANTALNLFVHSQAVRPSRASREDWECDSHRRSAIQRAIEQESGLTTFQDWDTLHFETEVRFKREQWAAGRVPREFQHNRSFIYARAFLYALDAFDKFLGVLAKEPQVPEQVATFHGQMAEAFPNLRGVRNTAQHLEDRARGLGAGREPKPLDLKPLTNDFINASQGGVLVLNNLNGSRYGSTMSDGHFGEIDVSPESMQHKMVVPLQPVRRLTLPSSGPAFGGPLKSNVSRPPRT